MKLGISTYTYAWAVGVPGHLPPKPMTAMALLQKAQEYQVDCVQIADNLQLHTLSSDDLDDLAKFSAENNISIEVGTRGLQPQNILKYLEIAEKLKSPFLRVVIDLPKFHPSEQDVIAIINDLLPEFEARNIKLGIENHDRFQAKVFENIVLKTNANYVGICLDTVNSMGAGEGYETVVDVLAPYTINLHIKDFKVSRIYHMMGFSVEGTPAGKGQLPIKWILEQLASYSRCKSGILELWTPPENEVEKTLIKEALWAQESIAYLKPLMKHH